MTSYVAQRGDTIDGIANRYGLKKESIAWCNDYRMALVLRPADVVHIPPTDGACHRVIRTQSKDIRAIAEQYGIDDPYVIIDSPANDLPDIAPETLLPSGTRLFIPGGEGEIITWNAPVQQDDAGNVVAFDPSSPFSCGARSGGGTRWVNPLPNGTYVRGYYAGHSGIDIAAPTGTPIYAANGGPILYAGWNNWGYGMTVVIGHGPWSTLIRSYEQPRCRLRPGCRRRADHRLCRQHGEFLWSAPAFRDSFSQSAAGSGFDIGDWVVEGRAVADDMVGRPMNIDIEDGAPP